MTKSRIFLVHGWGGSPSKDWFPWATSELTQKGYEVIALSMPDTDKPVIAAWVEFLSNAVGDMLPSDIFIGHSIGCQTILRYLERTEGATNKVIIVAPWFTLTNLENNEAWEIADPWFKTPMDFAKIKPKSAKFIAIFSDNDSWVPFVENKQMFTDLLNPEIITLHNKGHITGEEGSIELPELLDIV